MYCDDKSLAIPFRNYALIGYARVSANEQDATAQVSALKSAGCARIFRETTIGGRWHRKNTPLQKLCQFLW